MIITFVHPNNRIEAQIVCINVCIVNMIILYLKPSNEVKKKSQKLFEIFSK